MAQVHARMAQVQRQEKTHTRSNIMLSINEIKAFASWDKQSCLESLPTTNDELFYNYEPQQSRFADHRAKKKGKSGELHKFDRSLMVLLETLRPFPPKPLPEASEETHRVYTSTYNKIRKQRVIIKQRMQDMQQQEEEIRGRDDDNDEAGLDNDDDDFEGRDENDQEGQLDPHLALMFYERHVQLQYEHQRQRDQQNSQFLLQVAGSPHFRRPASAPTTPNGAGVRRRRQAEVTPRRVRRRTLFHDSASAQGSPSTNILDCPVRNFSSARTCLNQRK